MDVTDTVFKNDTVYMKSLVGKSVRLVTKKERIYYGTVFVIDPVYKTVVLHININEAEKYYETVFVLFHAVKVIDVLSEEINTHYLGKDVKRPTPFEDYEEKKRKLMKWLRHMLLIVEESGDCIKVDDHIVISPPYEAKNCTCSNTVILERIMEVIQRMPSDFT